MSHIPAVPTHPRLSEHPPARTLPPSPLDARYPPPLRAPHPAPHPAAASYHLRSISYGQPTTADPSHSHSHSPYAHFYTSVSVGDRVLRSPHPPLTATYPSQQYLWPHPLPPIESLRQGSRPHPQSNSHSPIFDQPRAYYNHPSVSAPSLQYRRESHPSYPTSPFLPPPTPTAYYQGSSPLRVPPPLRFNYSQSPPPNTHDNMPPRAKADSVRGHPSTPSIASATSLGASSVASTRARRGANGKGWTTEHTLDPANGQRKEVIVIDDSASPMVQPIRKRTRAQVAAEQAAAQQQQQVQMNGGYGHTGYTATSVSMSNGHGSVASNVGTTGVSSAKKRKLDDDAAGKKAKPKVASTATSASVQTTATYQSAQQAPAKSYAKAPVQQAPASGQPTWDDREGHYIIKPDDVIGGKYKIVRLLGQGTFGKVVEARHIQTRRKVAIKVIRAVQKYREASKIEIRVLEMLKKHDPRNDNKCIHLDEYFDFRNHPCLVSELYGMSVFDFLKNNGFQPFPDKHIQDFARSLLRSVSYLHSLKLVHTDLKPENILLCSNESRLQGARARGANSKSILRNTEIRLIDFGSATFESEYHSSVVSTRHYRAPEIILGLPWSYPCDMFSIGCILVEFYTGNALFQTHDNLEHLAMMEIVMGKFSPRMIEKGKSKKPEYFKGNKIDFPNSTVSKASRKYVKAMHSLKQVIDPTNRHQQLFLDLCTRLLEHDPDIRIKVQDALRHPYLTEPIPEPH
ncbi:CMGC/CLK protein kinase [Cryptococcus wingfieldii CBS 7118]|uniref:CMGC/CLK protein kinase n=1 Tax=Cryptococcus wingfieldii CBS 7118 TaxID=1295528 RepID=A0A1E3JHR2_9TREE|nr:CMGC/CLK protein kinase [Cryptococcus wingfieldii CBS 7118]ODN99461.1 CMGC/CLK protein kinase [Cryptococcus wingfieldii CBS 7118]